MSKLKQGITVPRLWWSQRYEIETFDAFVFVTPEYNHSVPGALKNAVDYLYAEWNNKAAGFVSYGSAGGALKTLRQPLAKNQWKLSSPKELAKIAVNLDQITERSLT